VAEGFKINKRGIEEMMKELQREFDKHAIRVAVQTEDDGTTVMGSSTTNYYGPVVTIDGDHAQVAWDNDSVTQNQMHTEQVTEGYESLAAAVVEVLKGLQSVGLATEDRLTADEAGKQVLTEITQPKPDRASVKRGLTMLMGVLAPIVAGGSVAIEESARQWATTAIEQLGHAFGG
jgi:hypothetical protein